LSRPSEEELIARFFAPLATLPGADGLRDDVAVLTPPAGASLVVTADALVDSVHFLPDDPPDTIARKALRVNLSDLAAKGATPYAFTLTLALPGDWSQDWLASFAQGLGEDSLAFACPLVGGDTVRTPGPLTIAVTAFGLIPAPDVPRRGAARPGDVLYLSGTIGDGALGLLVRLGQDERLRDHLSAAERAALVSRYRLPQPRMALAAALRAHARAAMDVSDGLVADLGKLLRASGASAEVELQKVALSPAVCRAIAAAPELFDIALTGGDDYEILCAVPPGEAAAFEAMAASDGVAVARIGTLTPGSIGARFRRLDGTEHVFARAGFSHF
jgi:thiamine-monophosphate kinase